jgi:Tfp pilus assembly protein PilE
VVNGKSSQRTTPRDTRRPARTSRRAAGLTLIEALIGLAGAAIVTAVAMPAYSGYLQHGRLPNPFADLAQAGAYLTHRLADADDVWLPHCAAAAVAGSTRVRYTCATLDFGQGAPVAAIGIGRLAAYSFTLDTGRAAR